MSEIVKTGIKHIIYFSVEGWDPLKNKEYWAAVRSIGNAGYKFAEWYMVFSKFENGSNNWRDPIGKKTHLRIHYRELISDEKIAELKAKIDAIEKGDNE